MKGYTGMNIADGTTFGYWTTTADRKKVGRALCILCVCRCGGHKYVRIEKLLNGTSKSCGCYRREARTTHGKTATAVRAKSHEYWIWNSMVQRCTNPNNSGYQNYGGRGITICDTWLRYEGFIADMGERPSDKHSIDRLDNDKGYSPDNCAWVERKMQARNKRNNRILECNGISKTLAEWSEISGVGYATIIARIKSGWDVCRAVSDPVWSSYRKRSSTSA
jgi:hypothetical protein